MDSPYFPPETDWKFVTAVCFGCIVIFHFVLIFAFRIGKRGWKIADYFWLASAAIGLLGAAGQARQLAAQSQLTQWGVNTAAAAGLLHQYTEAVSSESSVCRQMIESPDSVSKEVFTQMERERLSVCTWLRECMLAIQARKPSDLSRDLLPPEPSLTIYDYQKIVWEAKEHADRAHRTAEQYMWVEKAAKRSPREESFVFLSPYLLAVALALRITKVTGELRLGN